MISTVLGMYIYVLTKNGLGCILGVFITNSSGHPYITGYTNEVFRTFITSFVNLYEKQSNVKKLFFSSQWKERKKLSEN
jgi:hypothetical protein